MKHIVATNQKSMRYTKNRKESKHNTIQSRKYIKEESRRRKEQKNHTKKSEKFNKMQ